MLWGIKMMIADMGRPDMGNFGQEQGNDRPGYTMP